MPAQKQATPNAHGCCMLLVDRGKKGCGLFSQVTFICDQSTSSCELKKKCICLDFDLPLLTHQCLALEHRRSVPVVMYVHTDSFSITTLECEKKKMQSLEAAFKLMRSHATSCFSCWLMLPYAVSYCPMLLHAASCCLSNQRDRGGSGLTRPIHQFHRAKS